MLRNGQWEKSLATAGAGQSLDFEGTAMGDLVSGDAEKPPSCWGRGCVTEEVLTVV